MRFLLLFAALVSARLSAFAEPLLKPNDVIALVGGEDMVVASELGYLEAFVQKALPEHHLKFRSLAWEGDTVFEQRRDLNYPSLEAQLEKIGATVVIAQFGQMEGMAGKQKVQEFEDAYRKLIVRLAGANKRRVVVLEPTPRMAQGKLAFAALNYVRGAEEVSPSRDAYLQIWNIEEWKESAPSNVETAPTFRKDGFHLDETGHWHMAQSSAWFLVGGADWGLMFEAKGFKSNFETLRALVIAKNRLWFNYARPQNWAFLAGDRTNQPSSRDHIDRNKRWFPEELEQFVPLIEAKEKEIWAAAKLKP